VRGALNAGGNRTLVRPHEEGYIEVKQDAERSNRLTKRTRSEPGRVGIDGGYGGDAEYHDQYSSGSVFFSCLLCFILLTQA
jgi:hypothetical protein